jgi:hypothetical protein
MQPREPAHRVLRCSIASSNVSAGTCFSLGSPSAERERGTSRSLELRGSAIEYATGQQFGALTIVHLTAAGTTVK